MSPSLPLNTLTAQLIVHALKPPAIRGTQPGTVLKEHCVPAEGFSAQQENETFGKKSVFIWLFVSS